jgi:hypothetical protein
VADSAGGGAHSGDRFAGLDLVGVVAALVLLSAPPASEYFGFFFRVVPGALVLAIGLGSILWIGVDARPAVAFITYFVLGVLQSDAGNIGSAAFLAAQVPLLLIAGALAALAFWLLRRQSARGAASRAK